MLNRRLLYGRLLNRSLLNRHGVQRSGRYPRFIRQKLVDIQLYPLRLRAEHSVSEDQHIVRVLLIPRAERLHDGVAHIDRRAVVVRHEMDRQRAAVHIVFERVVQSEIDRLVRVNLALLAELLIRRLYKSVKNRLDGQRVKIA